MTIIKQITKTTLGLDNVDNTSDVNKPVSTAQQTAINNIKDTTAQTGILKGNGSSISAAVSGTDIKTIDSTSLLGSGNISIKDTTAQTGILKGNGSSISAAVSGTDIKTINSTSLLGSGDINIGDKFAFERAVRRGRQFISQ